MSQLRPEMSIAGHHYPFIKTEFKCFVTHSFVRKIFIIINRPGVAGAVLQTSL